MSNQKDGSGTGFAFKYTKARTDPIIGSVSGLLLSGKIRSTLGNSKSPCKLNQSYGGICLPFTMRHLNN